MKRNQGGN